MEPPAGLQHPAQLGQRARHVRDVFDDLHRHRGIENLVRIGEHPDVTDDRLDRRDMGAFPFRGGNLVLGDVDPRRQTVGTQRQANIAQEKPRAASDLDHPLAAPGRELLQHGVAPRRHLLAGGEALLDGGDFTGEVHGAAYRFRTGPPPPPFRPQRAFPGAATLCVLMLPHDTPIVRA